MAKEKLPPQLFCCECGRHLPTKEFWGNYNEFHKSNFNRMNYCKDHCKEISNKIFEKYSLYELACREMCSFFHMPFISEACKKLEEYEFNTTNVEKRDFSRVFQYMTILKELDIPNEHWDNLSGNSFLSFDILKVAKGRNEGDNELFLELEKEWGKQDKLAHYIYLEEKLDKYSAGEKLSPSMKTTMKYLCLAELEVMKLKEAKEDTTNAEKKVMGYYSKLKLDDFKLADSKSIGEKMLESWIETEEQYRPAEVVDKLFMKDICNIGKDNDHILRSIRNVVAGSRDYPDLSSDEY